MFSKRNFTCECPYLGSGLTPLAALNFHVMSSRFNSQMSMQLWEKVHTLRCCWNSNFTPKITKNYTSVRISTKIDSVLCSCPVSWQSTSTNKIVANHYLWPWLCEPPMTIIVFLITLAECPAMPGGCTWPCAPVTDTTCAHRLETGQ